jgi:hypothetical protein
MAACTPALAVRDPLKLRTRKHRSHDPRIHILRGRTRIAHIVNRDAPPLHGELPCHFPRGSKPFSASRLEELQDGLFKAAHIWEKW